MAIKNTRNTKTKLGVHPSDRLNACDRSPSTDNREGFVLSKLPAPADNNQETIEQQ